MRFILAIAAFLIAAPLLVFAVSFWGMVFIGIIQHGARLHLSLIEWYLWAGGAAATAVGLALVATGCTLIMPAKPPVNR